MLMASSVQVVAVGLIAGIAIALLGLLIARSPEKVNRMLKRSRSQLVEYSDLYIRIFGIVVSVFGLTVIMVTAVLR